MADERRSFREPSLEEFISAVRGHLGIAGPRRQPPEHAPLQQSLAAQQQKVTAIQERLAAKRGELVERLEAKARLQGWQVSRLYTETDIYYYVAELTAALDATAVVRTDHPVLRRLNLEEVLAQEGIAVTLLADGGEAMRYNANMSDIGLTGVDYAIAETATCVLLPRRGVSRTVHVLPPVYVAVVEAQQIVETLEDIFALRRLEFLENGGRLDPYMTFVSGPSRTADIEQTIVIGAHGPREAHMLILNDTTHG